MVCAGALLAVMGVAAPAAHATSTSTVTCGEKVRQDIVLTANLGCPTSPILRIAASGVTVNLHGYTLSVQADGGPPLVVDSGHPGFTLENGGLDPDAQTGVAVSNVDDLRIKNVGSSSNVTAMTIFGGHDDVITNSDFQGNQGSSIDGTTGLLLAGDEFFTGAGNGPGLTLDGRKSSLDGDSFFGETGLALSGDGNVVDQSTLSTLDLTGGSRNVIEDNQFQIGPIDVEAAATRAVVDGNTVANTTGIDVAGSKAVIEHNTVSRSVIGIIASGPDAYIYENTADDTAQNGIEVSGADARVIRNTADGDGQNGIEVTDPTAVISANTTDDNAQYGISATAGDTGTRNIATGNNDGGAQCLNISCS
jgi:hypothetical protein